MDTIHQNRTKPPANIQEYSNSFKEKIMKFSIISIQYRIIWFERMDWPIFLQKSDRSFLCSCMLDGCLLKKPYTHTSSVPLLQNRKSPSFVDVVMSHPVFRLQVCDDWDHSNEQQVGAFSQFWAQASALATFEVLPRSGLPVMSPTDIVYPAEQSCSKNDTEVLGISFTSFMFPSIIYISQLWIPTCSSHTACR